MRKDDKDKLKIIVSDKEADKTLTMNFCTKAKLERVLQEQLGYGSIRAHETANAIVPKLSDEQKRYFLSGSRQLEDMAYYEKDIRLENENVLTDNFSFVKMQFKDEEVPRLTITDRNGNFAVLSANMRDRAEVERKLRQHLKVENIETIKAVMAKAERLGFVETPKQVQFKEYLIERETQSAFTVRGGTTVVRLDLSDKETAKKQLRESFGMSVAKAERIIVKAQRQSIANNLLKRARERVKNTADTLRNKKIERGSRK